VGKPLQILIIEDAEDDVELLLRELRRHGYDPGYRQVDSAETMQAALAEQRWDIVISDYFLPHFSAPAALNVLKQSGLDLPFIIVSGSIIEDAAVTALKAGAHDFMAKYSLARLAPAIERELREAQGRQERRRAEQALHESEERFRATFEQAAVGIAHVSLGGRLLRVNQKLCDILGYSREELVEKSFRDLTHPEDIEADRIYQHQVLTGASATSYIEKRYIRKDGSSIWANLTLSLVKKPSGEPNYFISVVEDITQHKSLEAQFQQAQKIEAIGRLSGGVAHDFNNLLIVINGYSDLLLQNFISEGEPARWYVEEIKKAGQRATNLTRQLLAFSRQQVLQPKILNLNEVVADMENMLRHLIGEDIELFTVLGPYLGLVKADPSQLEQVIVNLVVNARGAMPRGGKVIIETSQVELDEIYPPNDVNLPPGSYIMLAVSDTGHGMDTETRSQIFEPFFTTKEMGKGTGLGLASVYGIVKQSGGDIRVFSEPGQGAMFRIYLPCVRDKTRAPEPRLDMSEPSGGSEIVLLVEDEEGVRTLARRVLEMSGYTVLEAGYGGEALRLCQQHSEPIHLLLTDIVMPGGLNGRELAERLLRLRPELKVLYMSGYTDETIVPHEIIEPGLFFLQKPFTPKLDFVQNLKERGG
jgi:PAS domain S-box-containing protein